MKKFALHKILMLTAAMAIGGAAFVTEASARGDANGAGGVGFGVTYTAADSGSSSAHAGRGAQKDAAQDGKGSSGHSSSADHASYRY